MLRVLPLKPVGLALAVSTRRIVADHPGLIRRLGEYDKSRFVIDPTDLPLVICLDPNGGEVRVNVVRGPGEGDARIAGPLAALIGMVNGAFDGDALFFSRDLVIEGDTGAALALRNAIDDAEIDLSDEIARVGGPFAPAFKRMFSWLEGQTGVYLTRPEGFAEW